MDLNPREAVVDQKPSNPSEQEEEPTQALIVPENFVRAAMDSLNRLAADPGDYGGGPQTVAVVVGTNCVYTNYRNDHHCYDVR